MWSLYSCNHIRLCRHLHLVRVASGYVLPVSPEHAEPVGGGFTLGVLVLVVTANRHSSGEPALIIQDH